MRYRALFVGGGPLDGQERVFDSFRQTVEVRVAKSIVVYGLRYRYGRGRMETLIYSLFDFEETLDLLWSRYAGEDHA